MSSFFTIKEDYAVASFITGIIAAVVFMPVVFFMPLLAIILALLPIILGEVSLRGSRRGFAVTGIALGSLMLIYAGFLMISALVLSP